MSSRVRLVASCVVLIVVAGLVSLLAVDKQTPAQPAAVAAAGPPPAPVLSSHGRSATAELESWCWPPDGRYSCAAVSPTVGHQFPKLRARPRRKITLDTRIAAARIRIELSSVSGSGRQRSVRPKRLDSRRWRFRMPSSAARARIDIRYRDEGKALALILLHPLH